MIPKLSPIIAGALTTVLMVCPATAPRVAHAANRAADKAEAKQAEVVASQAKQAFKDKKFEDAARLFMKAYAISKQAALVFNAARAYEEAGKAGDAASLFRLYATLADDVDGVADARARIKRLETKPAVSAPLEPKPAGAKPVETKPVDSQPTDTRPIGPVAVVATKLSATPDRTLAWLATGGAAVLVGGGAVLAYLGAQKTHDANQLPLQSQADIDGYNTTFDRAELLKTTGISLLALGVVAGGAAAWLHLKSGASVTAGPDGRGGVWLAGRW